MPCFCWISDSAIEPEMKIIREHAREIIKQARIINYKGDLHSDAGPLPRSIMGDVHSLLDDLWLGKCSETGEEVK